MPVRDPFKYPYTRGIPHLESMKSAFTRSLKNPTIGVTQGGSSRRDAGCKVAATGAVVRQTNQLTKPTN